MDMIEVSQLIRSKISESEQVRRQIPALAQQKAAAERAYRMALSKKILELKVETKLAGNLIPDVAKGDEEVSKLMLARDIAEDLHAAKASALRAIQTEISALQSVFRSYGEV